MKYIRLVIGVFFLVSIGPSFAEESMLASDYIKSIREASSHKRAVQILNRDHDRVIAENIKLTEIPAPPFKEDPKAKVYLEMLRESGLQDVEMDAEGNVIGIWKGNEAAPKERGSIIWGKRGLCWSVFFQLKKSTGTTSPPGRLLIL